ncbi:MAG: sugar-binding domain-containing protein [Ignavibacteriaceae bacterium]
MLIFTYTAWAQPIRRAEYPRPQFERSTWINLNGTWTYSFYFGNSGKNRNLQDSKGFDDKIIVPFYPESKLPGVEHKDFINNMWYQRKISIPAGWSNKNILLNFGAVYYLTEVYIDGKFIGRHFGGTSSSKSI